MLSRGAIPASHRAGAISGVGAFGNAQGISAIGTDEGIPDLARLLLRLDTLTTRCPRSDSTDVASLADTVAFAGQEALR